MENLNTTIIDMRDPSSIRMIEKFFLEIGRVNPDRVREFKNQSWFYSAQNRWTAEIDPNQFDLPDCFDCDDLRLCESIFEAKAWTTPEFQAIVRDFDRKKKRYCIDQALVTDKKGRVLRAKFTVPPNFMKFMNLRNQIPFTVYTFIGEAPGAFAAAQLTLSDRDTPITIWDREPLAWTHPLVRQEFQFIEDSNFELATSRDFFSDLGSDDPQKNKNIWRKMLTQTNSNCVIKIVYFPGLFAGLKWVPAKITILNSHWSNPLSSEYYIVLQRSWKKGTNLGKLEEVFHDMYTQRLLNMKNIIQRPQFDCINLTSYQGWCNAVLDRVTEDDQQLYQDTIKSYNYKIGMKKASFFKFQDEEEKKEDRNKNKNTHKVNKKECGKTKEEPERKLPQLKRTAANPIFTMDSSVDQYKPVSPGREGHQNPYHYVCEVWRRRTADGDHYIFDPIVDNMCFSVVYGIISGHWRDLINMTQQEFNYESREHWHGLAHSLNQLLFNKTVMPDPSEANEHLSHITDIIHARSGNSNYSDIYVPTKKREFVIPLLTRVPLVFVHILGGTGHAILSVTLKPNSSIREWLLSRKMEDYVRAPGMFHQPESEEEDEGEDGHSESDEERKEDPREQPSRSDSSSPFPDPKESQKNANSNTNLGDTKFTGFPDPEQMKDQGPGTTQEEPRTQNKKKKGNGLTEGVPQESEEKEEVSFICKKSHIKHFCEFIVEDTMNLNAEALQKLSKVSCLPSSVTQLPKHKTNFYDHPTLRLLTNALIHQTIKENDNQDVQIIIDIGSKQHAMAKEISKMKNKTKKIFIAIRPNEDPNDKRYYETKYELHKKKIEKNMYTIRTYFNRAFVRVLKEETDAEARLQDGSGASVVHMRELDSNYVLRDHIRRFFDSDFLKDWRAKNGVTSNQLPSLLRRARLLSFDSCYYPGVLDGIDEFLNFNFEAQATTTYLRYAHIAGYENYFFEEGSYSITRDSNYFEVESKPRGNAQSYVHRCFPWSGDTCEYKLGRRSHGVEDFSFDVAPHASINRAQIRHVHEDLTMPSIWCPPHKSKLKALANPEREGGYVLYDEVFAAECAISSNRVNDHLWKFLSSYYSKYYSNFQVSPPSTIIMNKVLHTQNWLAHKKNKTPSSPFSPDFDDYANYIYHTHPYEKNFHDHILYYRKIYYLTDLLQFKITMIEQDEMRAKVNTYNDRIYTPRNIYFFFDLATAVFSLLSWITDHYYVTFIARVLSIGYFYSMNAYWLNPTIVFIVTMTSFFMYKRYHREFDYVDYHQDNFRAVMDIKRSMLTRLQNYRTATLPFLDYFGAVSILNFTNAKHWYIFISLIFLSICIIGILSTFLILPCLLKISMTHFYLSVDNRLLFTRKYYDTALRDSKRYRNVWTIHPSQFNIEQDDTRHAIAIGYKHRAGREGELQNSVSLRLAPIRNLSGKLQSFQIYPSFGQRHGKEKLEVKRAQSLLSYQLYGQGDGNALTILNRQTCARMSPEPWMLERYQEFADDYVRDLSSKITYDAIIDSDQYLKGVLPKKRKLYEEAHTSWLEGKIRRTRWQLLVKRDEVEMEPMPKNAPRCLFNPMDHIKGIVGAYNKNLLTILLGIEPGFVCGMSDRSLSSYITNARSLIKKPKYICLDGARHDAHQHIELIRAIDIAIWRHCGHKILDWMDVSADERRMVEESQVMEQIRFYYETRGSIKHRTMAGTILGTTFSGHPTRTTFGNTLRVFSYVRFAASLMQIPRETYFPLVSGDDVMIIVEDEWANLLLAGIRMIYGDCAGAYGLGLKSEEPRVVDERELDFLSREIYYDGFGFEVNRGLIKMLFGSTIQTGRVNMTGTEFKNMISTMNISSGSAPQGTQLFNLYIRNAQLNKKTAEYIRENKMYFHGASGASDAIENHYYTKYLDYDFMIAEATDLSHNRPATYNFNIDGIGARKDTYLQKMSKNKNNKKFEWVPKSELKNAGQNKSRAAKNLLVKEEKKIDAATRRLKKVAKNMKNVPSSKVGRVEKSHLALAKKHFEWFLNPMLPRRSLAGSDVPTAIMMYKTSKTFTLTYGKLAFMWQPTLAGNKGTFNWASYDDTNLVDVTVNPVVYGNVGDIGSFALPTNNGIRITAANVHIYSSSSYSVLQGEVFCAVKSAPSDAIGSWDTTFNDVLSQGRLRYQGPLRDGVTARMPPIINESTEIKPILAGDKSVTPRFYCWITGGLATTAVTVMLSVSVEWVPKSDIVLYNALAATPELHAHNEFLTTASKYSYIGPLDTQLRAVSMRIGTINGAVPAAQGGVPIIAQRLDQRPLKSSKLDNRMSDVVQVLKRNLGIDQAKDQESIWNNVRTIAQLISAFYASPSRSQPPPYEPLRLEANDDDDDDDDDPRFLHEFSNFIDHRAYSFVHDPDALDDSDLFDGDDHEDEGPRRGDRDNRRNDMINEWRNGDLHQRIDMLARNGSVTYQFLNRNGNVHRRILGNDQNEFQHLKLKPDGTIDERDKSFVFDNTQRERKINQMADRLEKNFKSLKLDSDSMKNERVDKYYQSMSKDANFTTHPTENQHHSAASKILAGAGTVLGVLGGAAKAVA